MPINSKLPILIVDDEPDAGAILAKLLSALGYETDVARDGRSALDLLENKHYGVAIVDYVMPGMNGAELITKMHELCPDTPAVLLTGYTTIDVVYPAVEAGVVRVLSKPVDFKELLPIVDEYLGAGV